jgi:hypothetical protein
MIRVVPNHAKFNGPGPGPGFSVLSLAQEAPVAAGPLTNGSIKLTVTVWTEELSDRDNKGIDPEE